jgi:hypothetical protein
MIVGIAGPYSAETDAERQANLKRLNQYGARVLEMGHIPFIGINAALPIVENTQHLDNYESIMTISMALMNVCEALLFVGESKGANREKALFLLKGLPVYYSLNEIPKIK